MAPAAGLARWVQAHLAPPCNASSPSDRPYQRTIRGVEDQGQTAFIGHPFGRQREFLDLPGDPLVTVVLHEVAMNFDELQMQPHIVFVAYEQQVGIPLDQLIDTCGQPAGTFVNSGIVADNPCPINPVLDKFLADAPAKTMVALLPHGIDVEKFDRVEEQLRSSVRHSHSHNHNHNRPQRGSSSR